MATGMKQQPPLRRDRFKVEIPGLQLERVFEVSGTTWEISAAEAQYVQGGKPVAREMQVAKLDNGGTLTLKMRGPDEALHAWWEDVVVNGNCGDDKAKEGSVVFYDRNNKEAGRLNYLGLLPFKYDTGTLSASSSEAPTVEAGFCFDEVTLELSA